MRRSVLVIALGLAVFSVAAGAAFAANGGNSANAKLCQKGGYTTVYRSDGSAFASSDECTAYAARGGVFSTKSKAQIDCESLGGTYGNDLFGVGATIIFACNAVPFTGYDYSAQSAILTADCLAAGGEIVQDGDSTTGLAHLTCFKP